VAVKKSRRQLPDSDAVMHVCATLLKLPGFDALKKKTEFRKQETEAMRNQGVENR
jgi:hypothetical protein